LSQNFSVMPNTQYESRATSTVSGCNFDKPII